MHLSLSGLWTYTTERDTTLVPSGLRSLASDVAVIKPLQEDIQVVTIALAWSADNVDPIIQRVVDVALQTSGTASAANGT